MNSFYIPCRIGEQPQTVTRTVRLWVQGVRKQGVPLQPSGTSTGNMLGTLLQNNSYYTYMHISGVSTTNNKNSAVTTRVRPCVPFTCFPRKNQHSTLRTLKTHWTGVPRKNSTTPYRAKPRLHPPLQACVPEIRHI